MSFKFGDSSNKHMASPFATERSTINPYLTAAGFVWRRLRWDLDYRSWVARWRLKHLLNTHAGKKAVILCNGPSLIKVDFDLLSSCYTFGLNKINLLFEDTAFRPSSITAVNPFVIEQNAEFYNTTSLPLFISSVGARYVRSRSNIIYLHSVSGTTKVARNCSVSINEGYTVTCVALQLAFHMGFSQVALVGCDHQFAVKGPANKTVIAKNDDESHFHPEYFSKGEKWQLPDLAASEFYYDRLRKVFEADGRHIVNCTEGGNLAVFDRMSLAHFVER